MDVLSNLPGLAAAVVLGYLLGSFPSGFLVGKALGVDVREFGSGRTGGTNVWRATGKVWAILPTGLGDVLKGALPILLARHFLQPPEAAAALAGAAAVIGHIWPLYLKFHGGAGGGTAGFSWVVMNPLIGVINLLLAVVAIYFSRIAAMFTLTIGLGGLLLSVALRLIRPGLVDPWHLVYAAIVATAIVITLQPNLKRMREGRERRITLW